jgi:ATPase complex subunit ATP10
MTNSRIGYVYLVDENLKVRWAACADAKAEEEEALIRCVGVLLNRHPRPSKRKPPP